MKKKVKNWICYFCMVGSYLIIMLGTGLFIFLAFLTFSNRFYILGALFSMFGICGLLSMVRPEPFLNEIKSAKVFK